MYSGFIPGGAQGTIMWCIGLNLDQVHAKQTLYPYSVTSVPPSVKYSLIKMFTYIFGLLWIKFNCVSLLLVLCSGITDVAQGTRCDARNWIGDCHIKRKKKKLIPLLLYCLSGPREQQKPLCYQGLQYCNNILCPYIISTLDLSSKSQLFSISVPKTHPNYELNLTDKILSSNDILLFSFFFFFNLHMGKICIFQDGDTYTYEIHLNLI